MAAGLRRERLSLDGQPQAVGTEAMARDALRPASSPAPRRTEMPLALPRRVAKLAISVAAGADVLGRGRRRAPATSGSELVTVNHRTSATRTNTPSEDQQVRRVLRRAAAASASAQLAILAAAAVDGRMDDRLVALGLAGDAGAHARQRLAPLLRDRLAAIVAFLGALARAASARGRAGSRPSPCRRSGPEPRRRASIRRPCPTPSAAANAPSASGLLWRSNIGLERPARHRRGDRALEPVLAHRRDAEHPIVDADVGKRPT